MPQRIDNAPGTINAARQVTKSIINPTKTGAIALPAFPKTPLMPSVIPCLFAQATIHAIPTG